MTNLTTYTARNYNNALENGRKLPSIIVTATDHTEAINILQGMDGGRAHNAIRDRAIDQGGFDSERAATSAEIAAYREAETAYAG